MIKSFRDFINDENELRENHLNEGTHIFDDSTVQNAYRDINKWIVSSKKYIVDNIERGGQINGDERALNNFIQIVKNLYVDNIIRRSIEDFYQSGMTAQDLFKDIVKFPPKLKVDLMKTYKNQLEILMSNNKIKV